MSWKKQPCGSALGGLYRTLSSGFSAAVWLSPAYSTAVQDSIWAYLPQSKFIADYVGLGGIEGEELLPSTHPVTISLPLKASLSSLCCSLPSSQFPRDFKFFCF